MHVLGYIIAGAVVAAAAFILIFRLSRFIKTSGLSACDNCPYSGSCAGSCGKRPSRKRK